VLATFVAIVHVGQKNSHLTRISQWCNRSLYSVSKKLR